MIDQPPVPILQHEDELAALLSLYAARRPKRVLEIGTYHGGTLWHWLRMARPGTTVVSVDSYATGVDNRHLYDEWRPDGVALVVIDDDSRSPVTVERVREHAPYEWIFIDAGHFAVEVLDDWLNYGKLCPPGGCVIFHDIVVHAAHPEIQVGPVWEGIKKGSFVWEEIVAGGREWGGFGIVYP